MLILQLIYAKFGINKIYHSSDADEIKMGAFASLSNAMVVVSDKSWSETGYPNREHMLGARDPSPNVLSVPMRCRGSR